jgi:hypothetical protein
MERKFNLPGSRAELTLAAEFTANAAKKALAELQRDELAQTRARQQPDEVLKSIGIAVAGGAMNLKARDLIGGLRQVVADEPEVDACVIIIIIIIIILVCLPKSAK